MEEYLENLSSEELVKLISDMRDFEEITKATDIIIDMLPQREENCFEKQAKRCCRINSFSIIDATAPFLILHNMVYHKPMTLNSTFQRKI